MSLRNYNNTSVPQSLVSDIDGSATALTVGDTSSFPAVPFILGLERGTVNQEVVLCTGVPNGTTFTVTRGYNGTTGIDHDSGATVEHTSAAIDYAEANAFVNLMTTIGDLIVNGVSGATRIGTGGSAANGYSLTADSTQPSGLRWGQTIAPGICAHTAASTAPTGWLVRNGAAVSRTTYAALFSAIGTTYGSGDGSTTFNVPDGVNNVDIGAGGTYALATTGGEASITLSTGQLPAHSHANTINVGGDPVLGGVEVVVFDPGSTIHTEISGSGFPVSYTVTPSIEVFIENTGSGSSINILNPYQALVPIIKY